MAEDYILHDCDTGSDDALALMMLLGQSKRVKTVAVTCVGGNTALDNVVMNNLRILKLFGQLGKIPVYRGCGESLLPVKLHFNLASSVHGSDGLGDVPDCHPRASPDLLQHLEKDHAVDAIIRLSKEYEGKLKIVATGPLANLAMAVKLDPDLPSRLAGLYVMGGTRFAKGNTSPAAEFNFYFDPEAAYITLHCFSSVCPIYLINYEYTLDNPISWDMYDEWINSSQNGHEVPCQVYKRKG